MKREVTFSDIEVKKGDSSVSKLKMTDAFREGKLNDFHISIICSINELGGAVDTATLLRKYSLTYNNIKKDLEILFDTRLLYKVEVKKNYTIWVVDYWGEELLKDLGQKAKNKYFHNIHEKIFKAYYANLITFTDTEDEGKPLDLFGYDNYGYREEFQKYLSSAVNKGKLMLVGTFDLFINEDFKTFYINNNHRDKSEKILVLALPETDMDLSQFDYIDKEIKTYTVKNGTSSTCVL